MSGHSITFVTPKYPPDTGGAARYYDLLASELADRTDVEGITVVTSRHPSSPLVEHTDEASVYRVLPRTRSGGRVHRALSFFLRQLLLFVIIPALCSVRADHVLQMHSTEPYIGRIGFNRMLDRVLQAISLISGTSFILDVRDRHTIPRRVYGFDAIICASETICEGLEDRRAVPEHAPVHLPVPIDIDAIRGHDVDPRLTDTLPDEYVCFVGDISAEKGAPRLVEATAEIDCPPVVLVGRPVDEPGRRLASSPPAHVTYLGPRSHDDALQIIAGATALVLPSESEGFPRVVLEAIALGTPVIVSSSIPELDDVRGVRQLHSRSVAAIQAALTTDFTEDRPRYHIQRHDIERVCTDLVTLYGSIRSADPEDR